MLIIAIIGEDPITAKCALGELNCHQTPCGKSKVNTSLCISKNYQRTYIEDSFSIFYQVRSVVLHIEAPSPKKPTTPNKIGDGLKSTHIKLWKEYLFLQYEKMSDFILLPSQSNTSLKGKTNPLTNCY